MKKQFSQAHILALKITSIIAGILIVIGISMAFFGRFTEKNEQIRIFQNRAAILAKNGNILELMNQPVLDTLFQREDRSEGRKWKVPGGIRNLVIIEDDAMKTFWFLDKEEITSDFFSSMPTNVITKKDVGDDTFVFYVVKEGKRTYVLYENLEFVEHMKNSFMTSVLLSILLFSIILYFVAYKLAVMTLKPIEQAMKHSKLYNHYIAHELKTPLAVIQSDLALAKKVPDDDSYIQSALDESRHLQNILDGLLFVSEEKTTLHKIPCDLPDLLQQAEKSVRTYFPEATQSFMYTGERKRALKADEKLLSILMKNLFENVFKYAKESSEVAIILSDNSLEVRNIAQKTISETDKLYVFEPFFSAGWKGTGLGLSIVKRICDLHSWNVSITHEGKVFSITLSFI